MMKPRFFPILVLLAVLMASCAPAAVTVSSSAVKAPTQPVASTVVEPTATPFATFASTLEAATQTVGLTEALAPTPFPVATSRGPNLEAIDPATVNLASGQIQFVEFFRFTWGTCRAMAPMVHGLEAKYFGRIKFTYLDADDSRTDGFQRALGFYYQPEVYLLDGNGKLLKKWVGYTTAEQFEEEFAKYVQ